ncbi:MAG: hypothetical protein HY819_01875 [Acidobacteria bacterium]|nr:hypothetical protein [Acidobacteriota bacterium]
MKLPKIFFTAFICLLFLTLTTNADIIKLKNGTVVKGKVVSFTNNSFTVALDLGNSSQSSRAILDIRDVESIEFENQDSTRASQTRESTVPRPSDPDDDTGHKVTNNSSNNSSRPTISKPVPATDTRPNQPISNSVSSANAKEVVAVVPAKDDWTYSNLTVRRGDKIKLSASGRVKISSSKEVGPEGVELEDKNKLLLDQPTGALIAVIGDDNDDFIYVGREGEFVAKRDGKLFLSVNEGDLTDNNGSFNVKVKVDPTR